MTTMNTSKLCQKQQKERACRQRIVVMPLRMGERGGKSYAIP